MRVSACRLAFCPFRVCVCARLSLLPACSRCVLYSAVCPVLCGRCLSPVVCRCPRVLLEAGVRRRSVVPFRPVRCAVLASTLHPRFTSTYPLHLRCSGASTFICACSAPPFARSLTLLPHTPALPRFTSRYLSLTPLPVSLGRDIPPPGIRHSCDTSTLPLPAPPCPRSAPLLHPLLRVPPVLTLVMYLLHLLSTLTTTVMITTRSNPRIDCCFCLG